MAQESLTIVSWGGAYTRSQVEAYHKPFAAMTGVKMRSEDYNGGLAQIKAQVDSGIVTWSLVDVELSDALRGCEEGILERIPPSILLPAPDGTQAEQDFLPGTLQECGVGTIVWSTVFAFNGDAWKGDRPTTPRDFFDTQRFPGKRGLRKSPRVNLEWALLADGVPASAVYEVLSTEAGVACAFAKLDTIKAHTVWWEAGAQPPQLLADGEVVMTSAYNGRLYDAMVKEGKHFVIVWDGQVWDIDLWVIPKGARPLKTIHRFIAFSTDTQRLADQTRYISYGPARKSSMPLVSEAVRRHLPTEQGNFARALQNNFEWWADHSDEMNERFAAWLVK
jgi:putative spermidine/putrescine transport system substrate-binding protein